MSVDFQVNVNVKPNGKEKIDELERQIDRLKSETVRINFDVNGTDGIEKAFKSMDTQMQRQAVSAGKSYQKSFNKGASSVKSNPIDFAESKVNEKKQVVDLAKQMEQEVKDIKTEFNKEASKTALKISEDYYKQQEKFALEEAKAQKKAQEQNLKQSRKSQAAIDKINAKQKVAQYTQRAIDKNAHNNALVESGKKMLEEYKIQQEQKRKIDAQAEKDHAKQVEKQTKKALSAENKLATNQKFAQYRQRAVDKNAHNKALVDGGKQFYNDKRAEIAERKRIQEQNKATETNIKNKLDTGKYDAVRTRMQSQLDSYRNQPSNSYLDNARSSFNDYNKSLDRINSHFSGKYTLTAKTLESEFKNLEKASTSFKNSMSEVGDTMEKTLDNSVFEKKANEVEKYFDRNIGAAKEYEKEFKDLQELYLSSSTKGEKDMLDDEFERLKYKTNERQKALNKQIQEEKRAEKQRSDEENRIARENEKRQNDVKYDIDTGKYDALSTRMQKQLNGYKGQDSLQLQKATAAMEDFDDTFKKLKSHMDGTGVLSDDEFNSTFENMNKSIDTFKNSMSEVGDTISKSLDPGIAERGANKVAAYYEENSKAVKKYGESLKLLESQYRNAVTVEDKANAESSFNSLKSRIKAEGLEGKTATEEMKRAFSQIGEFTGMYGAIQMAFQDLPMQLIQSVKDFDNTMTSLQMATGTSTDKAKELMSTYSEMGKSLKATGTDVAASSLEWLKQGKSIEEANKLAQDSIVLSKIGDLSSTDATKTITAAMKSYQMSESQVMSFVDSISAIDMASATDVGGLANAFNEVAANAKQGGVESEKLLAYAAAIGETTQEGMASVGTSLNAIFSRMGNIKLSRLKDFETGEDLSNVETVLKGLGISLRDSSDEFREFDYVLDDTAKRWDSFSGVQQRAVAQAFAG